MQRLAAAGSAARDKEAGSPRLARSWLRLIAEKIPFLLLSAASCAVTLFAQNNEIKSLQRLDLPSRIANSAAAYVAYVDQMFYPTELALLYPLPSGRPRGSTATARSMLRSRKP